MLIRALIVLLLVLNLGVALWWLSRPATPVASPIEPASDVARLQLVSEVHRDTAAAPPAAAAGAIERCVSFGPFADVAQAAEAQEKLQPQVVELQPRRAYAGTARSWKVFLPAFASIDAAEVAAAKVAAADFKDYFVVRDGEDARTVALGLYRSEATARERIATLAASGFEAELAPLGAGPAQHWLDVGAAAGFDPVAGQALTAAAQIETIDCARFAPPVAAAPAR